MIQAIFVGAAAHMSFLAVPEKTIAIGACTSKVRRTILRRSRDAVDSMLKLEKIEAARATEVRKDIAVLTRQVKAGWSSKEDIKAYTRLGVFLAHAGVVLGASVVAENLKVTFESTGEKPTTA